jgi:DNA-binding NarL/FixJ family response regulator
MTSESNLNKTWRILIVDDHAVMREGIAAILNKEPDLAVCGEAESPAEALERLEAAGPDLAIVDLSLKEGSGLDLIKDLHARRPDLPVLVLSMHDESIYAARVLHAGARGYLMKQESSAKVVQGVRELLQGRPYFSKAIAERVVLKAVEGRRQKPSDPMESLTDRELEVFIHIGKGLKPRQIAEVMNLSVKTVETYSMRIKQKLGLSDASELLQRAIQWAKSQDSV